MLSLRSLRPRTSCVQCKFKHIRSAHAATLGHDHHDHARRENDHHPSAHSRRKASYRFPTRGKRGGAPDPYEILDLDRSASPGEIKAQYYRLALLLHPDSAHPSASSEHFATLNRAYKLLSTRESRASYLATGYGWNSGSAQPSSPQSELDAMMRAEIERARRGGAARYDPYGWGRAGYRAWDHNASDAGRGAWGAYRAGEWHPYDADGPAARGDLGPNPAGETRYMSNNKFVVVIALLAALGVYLQVTAATRSTETVKANVLDAHLNASRALAEARSEAAQFGQIRREQIRRKVRESQVLDEIERLEQARGMGRGMGVGYEHGGLIEGPGQGHGSVGSGHGEGH